jgi:hypothetical protein
MDMRKEDFYQKLVGISELPAAKRHSSLLDLHHRVYKDYSEAVRQITRQGAARVVPDGRTVAQVVGHIVEWERAIIIALGEILAGVEWPRLMSREFNIDPDGQVREFRTIDEFNAYYARVYADERWEVIQTSAHDVAATLLRLFEDPVLLTVERLELTKRYDHYELPGDVTLSMPCGWYLWMATIEHEGIEHIADLHLGLN